MAYMSDKAIEFESLRPRLDGLHCEIADLKSRLAVAERQRDNAMKIAEEALALLRSKGKVSGEGVQG